MPPANVIYEPNKMAAILEFLCVIINIQQKFLISIFTSMVDGAGGHLACISSFISSFLQLLLI